MRGGILRASIWAVVAAAFSGAVVGAGTGASLATAAGPSASTLGLSPEVGPPVKPTHFRGDIRRIPRGNVVPREEQREPRSPNEQPGPATTDPALQTGSTGTAAPAPSSAFAGLDFANWGAGWPPDTNGDVGPSYYIQTVNTSVGIFDKSTGSRVAAFTFDSFFGSSPTGTPCDSNNQGDPVVVYDPIGDRWIIADFAWSNYTSGPMYECMAVSASGNPVSGGWYFYARQVESGGKLPDYPKLGVWPDGIYMSANIFSTRGSGSFQNVQVWAFDRAAMEAGAPAGSVTFALPKTVGGVTAFSLLPSNARAATGLPPSGRPNYFASIWGSYATRVWRFHVDWTSPASSTFTGPTNVPIATFNVGPSSVPEKDGNNIDTLSYRLMMQNQYANLNGTESLWLTHTVGNGGSPNLAQVRWYQLGVTGDTIAGSPTQQSTWAPDSKNRFMPSLAVDKNGDMAVGYSVSDGSMYPAIRYAGRLVGDPANTLAQGETSLIEGTGFQCCKFSNGSTNTRWGDYSAMTIDPDGCTFWYTNEYYDTKPTTLAGDNWKTRIGSFRFPSCSTAISYRATVLADNSVSYWRLGEVSGTTAADEQGANPGTYAGSPTLGQPGLLTGDPNTAVGFNGSSAKVELGSMQTPRTIEAWIKTTAASGVEQPIWSDRNNRAGIGNGIYFGTIEGRLFVYQNQWTPPQLPHDVFIGGGPPVADGLPHHVVWTYDDVTHLSRLYVDGQLRVEETQTGPSDRPMQPARIGWDLDNVGEFFNGTIDEVAVYGTPLSGARVLAHYQAGT